MKIVVAVIMTIIYKILLGDLIQYYDNKNQLCDSQIRSSSSEFSPKH